MNIDEKEYIALCKIWENMSQVNFIMREVSFNKNTIYKYITILQDKSKFTSSY